MRLEYDLKRILAGGQLDRMSLETPVRHWSLSSYPGQTNSPTALSIPC